MNDAQIAYPMEDRASSRSKHVFLDKRVVFYLIGSLAIALVSFGISFQSATHTRRDDRRDVRLVVASLKRTSDTKHYKGGNVPTIADEHCIFRNSSIYRKVFVYPTYGQLHDGWEPFVLSEYGKNLSSLPPWPWIEIDNRSRTEESGHYHPFSQVAQFATELIVREILTHPDSCLRTYDPEEAELFYVPYLPSVEFHAGVRGRPPSFRTSPYAQAVSDAIDGNYTEWEKWFGLTSRYWRRRRGADHILVFSEPLQGLHHPKNKRGNYHFIHTQRQLSPPIVISVELSTTFVQMYPKCARKNILLPYPISDGRYYNNELLDDVSRILNESNLSKRQSWEFAITAENELKTVGDDARPFPQWYKAGIHGSCTKLRRSMNKDFKCTRGNDVIRSISPQFQHGMRMSTFCPCPGGDTASAKRMFDAVLAGCIPVVLSYDFVWPLSTEFEDSASLNPADFSLRVPAGDFDEQKYNEECKLKNSLDPGLHEILLNMTANEIVRLRKGLKEAARLYSFYRHQENFPFNPVREGVLPDGGAAHALVEALGRRSRGVRWKECEIELKQSRNLEEPSQFVC